ncbi:MAG: T9SS type A sorting domain-containing protein [Candidatus Pacebacteria bacterium]|nr:T9SS type A sorting domain-containing protein [Candidatus Paceibacterota bacterium]MBP9058383.1 T9SS type A sorting domain-containing protein [Candidatus Paceibacterota bacterium]MBP9770253.1 T9SS type A sorting domain-containing protein [Candidatus Paceibacterota bacterium]
MKNLIAILLTALLGGATTTLFSQISWEDFDAVVVNEQWQCLDFSSNEDGSQTKAYLAETPYGTFLYGKFSEINGNQYNSVAKFSDQKLESAPFVNEEFNQIFQIEVNGDDVIFVTNIDIFSWNGEGNLVPWGIDIDVSDQDNLEDIIYSKIVSGKLVISGNISYLNGMSAWGAIIDLSSHVIEKIIFKDGYTGGDFDKLFDTVWFSYNYTELGAGPDWKCLLGYDLGTGQEIEPNTPFLINLVGDVEYFNEKIYGVFTDPLDLITKLYTFDGVNWNKISGGGHLFVIEDNLYISPGPFRLKEDGISWEVIVDSDSTLMFERTFWINGFWYGVANPGMSPLKAEWGDDFVENICANKFIAKLGEPEEEVSVTENISENFELYISGENLVINSKQNFLLQIYNISGQKILEKEIFPGNETFHFDQPAGIYLAKNKRFVKL